jgi:hypothetical protein
MCYVSLLQQGQARGPGLPSRELLAALLPAKQCLFKTCCLRRCRSKDKPEDLGFPPVEPAAEKPKAEGEAKPKPTVLKQLLNNVLKNPFIWGMALTYFFIYIVRQVRHAARGGADACWLIDTNVRMFVL